MEIGVTLTAEIKKIQTTIDGGWSITIHCGQDEVKKVAQLSSLRDELVQVAFVPHPGWEE